MVLIAEFKRVGCSCRVTKEDTLKAHDLLKALPFVFFLSDK